MKKLIIAVILLALAAFAVAKIMTKDMATPSQAVTVEGVTITPIEVLEDSRCPEDVQCIWAGRLLLLVNISKPGSNWNQTLELGKPVSLGGEEITLVSVSPNPKQGENIPFEKYGFEFKVETESQSPGTPSVGTCHITGCSAQLCTEESDVVSTCEWREAYACYQGAQCARLPGGKCGWVVTAELNKCLMDAN